MAEKNISEKTGVGLMMTKEIGIIGGDIDNCINPQTGEPERWVADILPYLDTYKEISPSGTGIRFFFKGNLPDDTWRKKGLFELYDSVRYLTLTGNVFGD